MDKKLKKAIEDDIGKRGDKGVSEVLRVVVELHYLPSNEEEIGAE